MKVKTMELIKRQIVLAKICQLAIDSIIELFSCMRLYRVDIYLYPPTYISHIRVRRTRHTHFGAKWRVDFYANRPV